MTRRASLAFAGPSLIAMAILAGLAAFSPQPMRAVIAVPLALLLPGYTIIRLLPRTRLGSDPVPLLAMSFVLSMASYPLLGLVLYGLGVRMSQTSVVVALAIQVAVLTAVGAAAHARSDGGVVAGPRPLRRSTTATVAVLAGMAIVAVPIVRALLPDGRRPPFSRLYLAGPSVRTPGAVVMPDGRALRVDVVAENHTGGVRPYTVLRRLDDGALRSAASFPLEDGARWDGHVVMAIPRSPCAHRVQIALRDDRRHTIVGALDLWARHTGSGQCEAG
jgi:hypothetical protein